MSSVSFRQGQVQKQILSPVTKMWNDILESPLEELHSLLQKITDYDINIDSKIEKQIDQSIVTRQYFTKNPTKNAIIEDTLISSDNSLYDFLYSQIDSSHKLFVSAISVEIAKIIVEYINEEGYYEGNSEELARSLNIDVERFESVRKRFAYLEPSGVGAKDFKEAMLFQLETFDLEEELYLNFKTIISDFENIDNYVDFPNFREIKGLFKKFFLPPAIGFLPQDNPIVADVIIDITNEGLNAKINSDLYPDISISEDALNTKNKTKLISDLLNRRKTTLEKIVSIILVHQAQFFYGGSIAPLKMQDIADEIGFNQSTISRAISNKYIESQRGIFAMKDFFSTAIKDDISTEEIKNYISMLIKKENKIEPLNDFEILESIKTRFGIDITRRTISKYRGEMDIPQSVERKKLYMLMSA